MPKSLSFAFLLAAASAASAAPSYSVVGTYKAADGGWDILSVDPVAHRLYVARRDSVTAVDLKSGEVTDKLALADGGHSALAIPGTSDVLVTNGNANNATIVDGRTGELRATVATGKKPDAATYDPATKEIWVMTPGDGNITVIDPVTAKAVATVQVGGSLEFGTPDGHGKLYVNVEDKNEVAVIDTRTRKLLRHEPLPGCDGPSGIAFDPATKETLSACSNGVAVVLSATGKPVASLTIGKRPDGAAFDERRHVALVPSGADGNLSIIELSPKPRVVATVQTAKSARTIALDPSTGRAYLPATDLLPPVGNERPKAVPGSFRIIVVAPST
ncbi:MAG TPA: YncE family protein [Sphingomicrobium sp.]|nr:YncE family protein [Sphingomicrobium sp.]